MAARKKVTPKVDTPVAEEEKEVLKEEKKEKNTKKKTQKYAIGSIVFIAKEAEADLNGFKLFLPYKKSTYTVEAYDENTGVYSLRRLNLLLKLKESDIVAPHEKSDSSLMRKQF